MKNLLSYMPAESWLAYGRESALRLLRAGEIIVSPGPGDAEGYFFLVCSGEAEILWRDGEGDVIHVAVIVPGDGLWKDIGVEGPSGTFIARAREDTEVMALSEEGYFRLHADHPELGRVLTGLFTERVRKAGVFLEEARHRRSLRQFSRAEVAGYWDFPWIVASREMKSLETRLGELARASGPILVEGEYGTGKKLAAIQIHKQWNASRNTFFLFDCATMGETDWEEKLLGRSPSPGDGERSFGALELAEGGTLYLRHCDQMPRAAQQALRELIQTGQYRRAGSRRPHPVECRVIVSARSNLAASATAGTFDSGLFSLLEPNAVCLPPLRDRKRDIPRLVEHFVATFSARSGVIIDEVSPEAMSKLLNHDFRLANVKELAQIIERAVALPSDRTIWPRHLFLGAPAVPMDRWRLDLLGRGVFRAWLKGNRFPALLQHATALLFVALILFSLLGPADPALNPATLLVWGVWWPLMFLSFYVTGRSWCGVCGYSTIGRLVQRMKHLNVRPPALMREHGPALSAAGLLLILWLEEFWGLAGSPRATGALMLSLLGLVAVSAMVFQRESWCRYLCPLGGMVGVCAMSSILEVRSNTETCLNQCKKSECYHGTATVPGCPMFEHLLFLDSNQTCKMCLNCVRSCPYDSVSLNLRLPGREIWMINRKHDVMSLVVMVLLGSALPLLFLQARGLGAADGRLEFTAAMLLAPLGAAALLWLPNLANRPPARGSWQRFWMTSYAYVPLAVAVHFAFRLYHAPGAERLRYSVAAGGPSVLEGALIQPVQIGAVAVGAIFSLFCLDRVRRNRQGRDFEASGGFWATHAALIWAYAALVAVLLAAPA